LSSPTLNPKACGDKIDSLYIRAAYLLSFMDNNDVLLIEELLGAPSFLVQEAAHPVDL
jgi:hypothetical protein